MPATRRRVAVFGCGRGELAIALALSGPSDVVAGFDPDATAIAAARRSAARLGVADRVTFEVAGPACLLGTVYDLIVLVPPPVDRGLPFMNEAGDTAAVRRTWPPRRAGGGRRPL